MKWVGRLGRMVSIQTAYI